MQPNDPYYSQQWYLEAINLTSAIWDEYNGKGVHVGIYDGGVDFANPDLKDNHDASLNFVYQGVVQNGNPNDASTDINERLHGTAVAGLIGASGNNGIGVIGVAWGSSLTSVNIFDSTTGFDINGSSQAGFLAALHHMADFDVINCSWNQKSFNYQNDQSYANELIEYQWAADVGRGGLGTVIVQSAGNNNTDAGAGLRNSWRYTITVGATANDGYVTKYSNYGSSVLITAPGGNADIVTTDRSGDAGYNLANNNTFDNTGNYTAGFDGTSASAPIVTGLVSLMLQANSSLGWRDVQDILTLSATLTGPTMSTNLPPLDRIYNWSFTSDSVVWNGGGQHFHSFYGYGLINAHDAVRMAESWKYFTPVAETSLNEATATTGQLMPNTAIKDDGTTTYGFHVDANVVVEHIDLQITLTKASPQDLTVYLQKPDGTLMLAGDLAHMTASSITNYTYTFGLDNARGTFSAGNWSLLLVDSQANFGGTLNAVNFTAYGKAVTADDVYHYTDEFSDMVALPQENERDRTQLVDVDGGSDWIDGAALTHGMWANLTEGDGAIDGIAVTLLGIDNAVGGDGVDSLWGTSGVNTLVGNRGDDYLDGMGGADKLIGDNGDDTYAVDSVDDFVIETTGQGRDTIVTSVNISLSKRQSIEVINVTNSAGATSVTLTGNDLDQILNGHSKADDVLIGKGGDDDYTVTTPGTKVIEAAGEGYDMIEAAVNYTLAGGQSIEEIHAIDGVIGEINLTGNALNQAIVGNATSQTLNGGGGDDTLYGGGGDDTLIVDSQTDTVNEVAGGGNDTLVARASYALAAGQSIETMRLADAHGTDGFNLTGNELYQAIYGNAGDNTLDGGGGSDFLFGYGGNDVYYVDNAFDYAFEDANEGNDRVLAAISYSLEQGVSIERLSAATKSDTTALDLGGNELAQRLDGNDGVNSLDGQAGADTLYGYAGDDVYWVDDAKDVVVEAGGEGDDRLIASTSYILAAGQSIETMDASLNVQVVGAMDLTGNEFGQTLNGNNSDNVLDGKGGVDTLVGNYGDDTYVIGQTADVVVEGVDAGIDTIIAAVNYVLAGGQSIEVIEADVGAGAVDIFGNEFAQTIIGGSGNDRLGGGGGDDRIEGGQGFDTAIFAGSSTEYTYAVNDDGTWTVIDNNADPTSEGTDALVDVEQLRFADKTVLLVDDTPPHKIALDGQSIKENAPVGAVVGVLAAVDDQDDKIVWSLAGGDDKFKLVTGQGETSLVLRKSVDYETAATHSVTVTASDGHYESARTFTITVKNMLEIVQGNDKDNHLEGASGGDRIIAGKGNDELFGFGGDDELIGGQGVDQLYGGQGRDEFVFGGGSLGRSAKTADYIHDFRDDEDDIIDLSAIDANASSSSDQAFKFIGQGGFHNKAGELRFDVSGSHKFVYGDTDGDGIADMALRIDSDETLRAADFIL